MGSHQGSGFWRRTPTPKTRHTFCECKMAGKYDNLDLGGLQLKCNEKTDETLERRMLQMCGEAKQAGTKTLMSLDDQAEQLDNIEGNLDKINNDMAESEK